MAKSAEAEQIFLVERYVPGIDGTFLGGLAERLCAATAELSRGVEPVRWLGSIGLVDDETCFCAFRATSLSALEGVNRLAGSPLERVVNALIVSPIQHELGVNGFRINPEMRRRRPVGLPTKRSTHD